MSEAWDPLPPLAEPARPSGPTLLAVDLGLRSGLAEYGVNGRLARYRSTNFGKPERLKRAVGGILDGVEGLARVVVEGDRRLGDRWEKEAARRGVPVVRVTPEAWREAVLGRLPPASDAKEVADALARQVIAWSGCARPTSLRHDAAEAILIGLWGVVDAGWLDALPQL